MFYYYSHSVLIVFHKFTSIVLLLVYFGLLTSFSMVYGDAEIKGNSAAIMFDRNVYTIPDEFNVLKIRIQFLRNHKF